MFHYVAATLAITLVISTSTTNSSPQNDWSNPNSPQYHIQTDEGNERYFRYQTLSGQYRKEKRLEDGTVVGTYAWIDDDGFLRQRDYIADNAGYRILKTKNVFVGRDTPIAQAIKQAKKVPAAAGTLVKTNVAPAPTAGTIGTPPYVEISPNAIPSSTASPFFDYSTTPSPISSTILPPTIQNTETPTSLYLPASTLALEPPRVSTESPYNVALNPWYYSAGQGGEVNNGASNTNSRKEYPFTFHNGPTYPIDNRGQTYTGNQIGNGYDPQYDLYDGVSVTNDGFRYYIPRAYHEEQNLPGDKKSGSFGYIDPFGIRRVIYYNAAPGTGFQHRKNNRYVGFNATPYDPRPYTKSTNF